MEQVSVIVRYLFGGSIHKEFIGLTEAHGLNAEGPSHTIAGSIQMCPVVLKH